MKTIHEKWDELKEKTDEQMVRLKRNVAILQYEANKVESKVHTICGWCPKYGREARVLIQGNLTDKPSHGICDECLKQVSPGAWEAKHKGE